MKRPLRARYGARDNMHALLAWDGDPARLPDNLADLTDKPPNASAPGDRWWPSVGCGPLDDWWALWWTQPDDEATRAGMVRSEVALWHLDEIGDVTDLLPVLHALSGRTSLPTPPDARLGAVVEALMTADRRRPVYLDLETWPAVLAALAPATAIAEPVVKVTASPGSDAMMSDVTTRPSAAIQPVLDRSRSPTRTTPMDCWAAASRSGAPAGACAATVGARARAGMATRQAAAAAAPNRRAMSAALVRVRGRALERRGVTP